MTRDVTTLLAQCRQRHTPEAAAPRKRAVMAAQNRNTVALRSKLDELDNASSDDKQGASVSQALRLMSATHQPHLRSQTVLLRSSLSLTQWSVMLLLSVLDDLYATIDADGDGVLSKPEFAKMYKVMKAKMDVEQKAAEEEHARLTKSQRRSRLLCAGISMAVPIMLILLLGNMGLVYTMLQMTKETHTKNGQLEDRSGHVVATAHATHALELKNLATLGRDFDYTTVETFQMDLGLTDGMIGARVIGYRYYNATCLNLFLETGVTVHVGNGNIRLAPTVQGESSPTVGSGSRRQLFGDVQRRSMMVRMGRLSKEKNDAYQKILDAEAKAKKEN